MAIRSTGAIGRQLGILFNLGAIGELTDGQLLERFATQGGEAAELAFAALVERHGPMVLRVCRNTLRDPNDVQDAFQATFLVLVKKARSLWVRDSLGPWLHRVAYRIATRDRSASARRRQHEQQAAATRPTFVLDRGDRDDLVAQLHAEIERLPERYRVLVVICDLEGLSHDKAARHLGWPVGTVKSRLAKARELLRGRFSRRGLGMPAGLLTTAKGLGGSIRAGVVVPGTLVESTVQAAAPFAAGQALGVGLVSTRVAILIEEALKIMFLSKFKLAATVVMIGAVGAAGVLAQQRAGSARIAPADQQQEATASESRQSPGTDSKSAPAYITQSRALIITRLQEEVAESRARLDRIHRTGRSPGDPAVVHARKTYEDLQQRLDRIDHILVDVVETYPTMVDFSNGPGVLGFSSQPGDNSKRQPGEIENRRDVMSTDPADLARARDRAEWARRMFEKGYVSRAQLDEEIENLRQVNARLRASQAREPQQGNQHADQPQDGSQKNGQGGGSKSAQHGQSHKTADPLNSSQGEQGQSQQGNKSDQGNPAQGQSADQQRSNKSDQGNPAQGQSADQQRSNKSDQGNPAQGQSADQQQRNKSDQGNPAQGQSADQQQGNNSGQGQSGGQPAGNAPDTE